MSRITIADLNPVNQVTELSEVELAATKGGFLFLLGLFSYKFKVFNSFSYGHAPQRPVYYQHH